ncbi:MAG TPA: DUF4136 domain-containing protein [Paraburkholderia sp.]|uniref:DUF4136 domain-containing protein n=1 Tax=Paraburkholderia sp. TaxID=1926495 RepID=UPI002B475A25|nr:DUF4136 domain-containing protein [Paraburkholderia sp.]HKR38086.1 DUF4136 domain-containing protein [Paraburkholderia sp.]
MKKVMLCAMLVASIAGLAGCTGVTADVQATGAHIVMQGERTYAIVRSPSQRTGGVLEQYEALIRSELRNYGLVNGAGDQARYMMSLAFDTRPAVVGVSAGDCRGGICDGPKSPVFPGFGRRYEHSLTLRFFEAMSGTEVYKVIATSGDRDADPAHSAPYLVKSALAQFPFPAQGSWRITLRAGEGVAGPEVASAKHLEK